MYIWKNRRVHISTYHQLHKFVSRTILKHVFWNHQGSGISHSGWHDWGICALLFHLPLLESDPSCSWYWHTGPNLFSSTSLNGLFNSQGWDCPLLSSYYFVWAPRASSPRSTDLGFSPVPLFKVQYNVFMLLCSQRTNFKKDLCSVCLLPCWPGSVNCTYQPIRCLCTKVSFVVSSSPEGSNQLLYSEIKCCFLLELFK